MECIYVTSHIFGFDLVFSARKLLKYFTVIHRCLFKRLKSEFLATLSFTHVNIKNVNTGTKTEYQLHFNNKSAIALEYNKTFQSGCIAFT